MTETHEGDLMGAAFARYVQGIGDTAQELETKDLLSFSGNVEPDSEPPYGDIVAPDQASSSTPHLMLDRAGDE